MSGAATVGRLVVSVSGDVDQLKIDMREAQAITGLATKEIVNGLQGITDATYTRNAAGQRMVAALREEIATFGMSADEIKIYKASLLGVEDEVSRLVEKTNAMKSAQAAFTQEAAAASNAFRGHGAAANEARGHVEGFSFATAGAKRELLVLAHELSQGNYKRFGGSMMVLGEQTGAAGLLFSAAGLAAIGMGAAIIGTAVAIEKGAAEQRAMNNALILSGNYAGQTSDSLNALAHAAVESGGSIGEAKKAVTQLAESGKFTGEQLGSITSAVVAMEHATGQSIEETIKQFESLAVQAQGHSARASTAISQATVKLDEQYHFLTLSVYDQITAMEKEGDLKGASKIATEEFARVTHQRAEEIIGNLGNVASAWHWVKDGIGGAIDALGEWGKKSTEASRVAEIQGKIAALQNDSLLTEHNRKTAIAELTVQLTAAQGDLNRVNKIASSQATETMAQSNAVQAAQRIDAMLLRAQTKEQGALTTALNEYHESLDRIRAGSTTEDIDPRLTDKAIKAGEAALTKLHSQAVKGNDDRAARLQDALTLEQTALDRETSIYNARGKMLDTYHKSLGMADADFYDGEKTRRTEYVASEAAAFAREAALIQASAATNPQEIAARKQKYDALIKQHLEFIDKMNASAGKDTIAPLVDEKKQFDDYMAALDKGGEASIKSLDAQIAKEREHGREIGLTKEQIDLLHSAQQQQATDELQAQENAIGKLLETMDVNDKSLDQARKIYAELMSQIDAQIHGRRTLAAISADNAVREADAKAAADASKAWKHAASTIENDLTNAILDGGGKGWKKLVHDMEFAFARMILSPILQPISGGIASYLNPLASQAQAGGAAGLSGAVGVASNAYSLFTGGMSLAGGLGTGFMGSVSSGLLGAGAGSGMTSATGLAVGNGIAGVVGPAAAGAISSGMTMVAAAMPWLAAAAIGGVLLSKAFGHGDRQTTSSTLTGSFGANGFSGATNDAWKEAGGWFSSDKTGVTSTATDSATAKQFGDGYKALQTAAAGFASAIGADASSITTRSQTMSIALTSDANANQKAIADFFAGVGDSMATELIPNLADFTKSGESASATLQRLAGDFQATDQLAAMFGKSAADVFGAVGMASATARERLIDLSGGIAALGSKAQAYQQAFLTDAEKIAPVVKTVGAAMASLGLSSITTKDQFKTIVNGLNLATEAGAKEYASLMDLAPAFAQAADYADTLTKATIDKAAADKQAADALAASAAKEQRGLDIQLMTALGNAEGALAATRQDSLDAMLSDQARLTQQQIWAADEAAAATAKSQASAAANVAATQSFGTALVGAMNNATAAAKALRAFNDSLLLGNLSPLTKAAQYDVAKKAYAASPNDQAAASAFLQASQAKGGSKLDYARDFAMVIAGNSAAAAAKDSQAAAIPAMWASFKDALSPSSLPAHANGGIASGWSIVGEKGPELANFTSPARIYTASQTQSMLGGGNAGLREEIKQLRTELNSALQAIAVSTSSTARHAQRTSDVLQRVTRDGNSLLTSAT